MHFIYHAPLQFSVPANVRHSELHLHDGEILVKYVEDPDPPPCGENDLLEIQSVWRSDGTREIDKRWFELKDLGSSRVPRKDGRTRMIRLRFKGEELTRHLFDRNMCIDDPESQALHDAFLEQDTIQILVNVGTKETAPLIMRLGYR